MLLMVGWTCNDIDCTAGDKELEEEVEGKTGEVWATVFVVGDGGGGRIVTLPVLLLTVGFMTISDVSINKSPDSLDVCVISWCC